MSYLNSVGPIEKVVRKQDQSTGLIEIRRSPFTGGGSRTYELHDPQNDRIYFSRYGRTFDTVEDAIAQFEECLKPHGFLLSPTVEVWPEHEAADVE